MHSHVMAAFSADLLARLELKAAEFFGHNNQALLTVQQVENLRILALAIVIGTISDQVADHCGTRLDELLFPADVADEPTPHLPAALSSFMLHLATHVPANVPATQPTQVR